MQAWFQMLDFGLSPTMGREVARYRGGALSGIDLRRMMKSMEGIFFGVAIIGAVLAVSLSGKIAGDWLKVQNLSREQVTGSVALMGVAVALRWVSSIYRSAISGFEHQIWLNGYNVLIATIRFFPIILVFMYISTSLMVFFSYQLFVASLELVGLAAKSHRLMPVATDSGGWSLTPLQGVYKFSLTYAITTSIWVMVTQVDKLVLSKILTLADFGIFSLGVLVAAAIGLVSSPISLALLPRLVKLNASSDEASFLSLYRRASRWVCIVVAPATLTMACFAEYILWAWTDNWETALKAAPILRLYAIGNGILSVVAFQSYLQFAKGNLRLHFIGNLIFVVILIPLLIWAAKSYGGVGVGYVWVGECAFYLLVWTWVVHRKFAPGLHSRWLFTDVLPIWFSVVLTAVIVFSFNITFNQNRWLVLLSLAGFTGLFFLSGLIASRETRDFSFQRKLTISSGRND
jgi:O-antigen/teichoic acid export membrane protein